MSAETFVDQTVHSRPAWLREIDNSLGTNAQFVLTGNIRDRVLNFDEQGRAMVEGSVIDALWTQLAPNGYRCLLIYDPVDGLSVHPDEPSTRQAVEALLGRQVGEGSQATSLERLAEDLGAVVHAPDTQAAVIIDYASRIPTDPRRPSPEERDFFVAVEKLSHAALPNHHSDARSVPLHNPVVWLVGHERDLPDWLVTGNDAIRTVTVPMPTLGQRTEVARFLATSFEDFESAESEEQRELIARFAQQTDGMTITAMFAIATLADDQQELGMRRIDDAARAHRVGIVDNPWRDQDVIARIAAGEHTIRNRVIGQEQAVQKSLDILMRSATGLTGAHASPYATRPRGVLFFAGPTGVGKTELAKQLTELVFGDEHAYTRFDMSEFSAEHSAGRLIGAPPGYVGFDSGGELTNAVRERPFSLILFDEIEKAHGRILDKFLQILEDGRLTDGRGATVFFSEAILVFTSNLGIYVDESVVDADGNRRIERRPNVTRELFEKDQAEAEGRVLDAIKRHFREELGRPELLNRLGDNIVVFDFITKDHGEKIFDVLLGNIERRVEREHKRELTLEGPARATLLDIALEDLDNGGRGIGSALENALTNPLARSLFAQEPRPGAPLRVREIRRAGRRYDLELL
ncbi:MAG: AAA family ATPase [Gaiellaceae bacterium MAG52_C11]|nr:AAA family ATPase [Candidatus Gaiellasilicea maunaloa]